MKEYIMRYENDVLQLLPNKMQELVRCKNCQFMYVSECDPNKEMWCCAKHHILATVQPEFFCADEVKK